MVIRTSNRRRFFCRSVTGSKKLQNRRQTGPAKTGKTGKTGRNRQKPAETGNRKK